MKTRSGFVSNSSTSSFIVMGYRVKDISEDLEKQGIDTNRDKLWELSDKSSLPKDIRVLYDEPDYLIGVIIADVSSDGDSMPDIAYSIDSLNTMAKEIQKSLKTQIEPKLILGTRPS